MATDKQQQLANAAAAMRAAPGSDKFTESTTRMILALNHPMADAAVMTAKTTQIIRGIEEVRRYHDELQQYSGKLSVRIANSTHQGELETQFKPVKDTIKKIDDISSALLKRATDLDRKRQTALDDLEKVDSKDKAARTTLIRPLLDEQKALFTEIDSLKESQEYKATWQELEAMRVKANSAPTAKSVATPNPAIDDSPPRPR